MTTHNMDTHGYSQQLDQEELDKRNEPQPVPLERLNTTRLGAALERTGPVAAGLYSRANRISSSYALRHVAYDVVARSYYVDDLLDRETGVFERLTHLWQCNKNRQSYE